jgi:hypothetical protein
LKSQKSSLRTLLNDIEHEVVFPRAVFDVVNSMVNYVMMQISGSGTNCQVVFTSHEHRLLFNILLVDFLSPTDVKAPVGLLSYLDALTRIVANPQFATCPMDALARATRDFVDWLETEMRSRSGFHPWMPTQLCTSPANYSCGNIAKRNFLRLMRVASQLQNVLAKQNIAVSIEQSALALAEFDEHMRSIFNYHSSNIAEFLNNLRWGIYEYLQPEFRRSYRRISGDEFRYEYDFPNGVNNRFSRTCYWDLMNDVGSQPYMPRFQTERRWAIRFP